MSQYKITKVRAHLFIPQEILNEIDTLVGKRKRSEFIAEAARKELKRLKLQKALEKAAGAWRDENYPEISQKGAYRWVRDLREESENNSKHYPMPELKLQEKK